MPQTNSLFSTQTADQTSAATPQTPAGGLDPQAMSQLEAIQKKLEALAPVSAPATAPQQNPEPKKYSINFDPSKMTETDPMVAKDLQTAIVDPLNQALAEMAAASGTDPKLSDMEKALQGLTATVDGLAKQTTQREQAQSVNAFRAQLTQEVGDIEKLMKDPSFVEYIKTPITPGSQILISNVLSAAEAQMDLGTIKGYIQQFSSTQPSMTGDLPVTPTTLPPGASAGRGAATLDEINSLRLALRRGGDPAQIAGQVKSLKLFK